MKIYCVFLLMSTNNIPFLNIKKKITLNYPNSATIEFVPRDPFGWLVVGWLVLV